MASNKIRSPHESYLHGYSKKEQLRLYKQAEFLEPYVYDGLDLSRASHVIEVGCGVGAQTALLLQKYPNMSITAIDISATQIKAAQEHLHAIGLAHRVEFHLMNAENLSSLPGNFDGAFVCWFLEHVPNPVKVLQQIHERLQPGAPLYCTEVLNSSLFVDPYSPAILKYWFHFNDHQWLMNGHPFVGAQLGNHLLEAGFQNIQTTLHPLHFDSRDPELRKIYIGEFRDLLLSAYPGLLKAKKVTPALVAKVKKEIGQLVRSKNSVIFQAFVRALATR